MLNYEVLLKPNHELTNGLVARMEIAVMVANIMKLTASRFCTGVARACSKIRSQDLLKGKLVVRSGIDIFGAKA